MKSNKLLIMIIGIVSIIVAIVLVVAIIILGQHRTNSTVKTLFTE